MKVRQALALAINRDQIAKALLGPLGVEAKPLQNHLFMANQKGYKDNAGALSSPDVEEAKKLLDEAGWKVEGDVRKKDGKELADPLRDPHPGGVVAAGVAAWSSTC